MTYVLVDSETRQECGTMDYYLVPKVGGIVSFEDHEFEVLLIKDLEKAEHKMLLVKRVS